MSKNFTIKLITFLVIPLVANLLFILVTPINFFTYRSWEALSVFSTILGGPFYPNQNLETVEVGDLGHSLGLGKPRNVTFKTDQYGYRYSHKTDDIPIIIVGNSFVVGSGLSQERTLAEVLTNELNIFAYPYAPRSLDDFLSDSRFLENPPEFLILAVAERDLISIQCSLNRKEVTFTPHSNNKYYEIKILADRFVRNPVYLKNFLWAKLGLVKPLNAFMGIDHRLIFFGESVYMHPSEHVEKIVGEIMKCNQILLDRGIQLIFLPIPDKENIHYNLIPESIKEGTDQKIPRNEFLSSMIAELTKEDIHVVDIQKPYEEARDNGVLVFQEDDTHWNSTGVIIAVSELVEYINPKLTP